jgi:hypothetical protein
MIGAKTIPMTTISVPFEGPSATSATVARMTSGIARNASTIRMRTSSTIPRK